MSIQPQNSPSAYLKAHSSQRRKCDELGLCQALKPSCAGCSHHDTALLPKGGYLFAPGVIEGAPNTRAKLVRTGWRALAGLAGYAAGHASVWLRVFQ